MSSNNIKTPTLCAKGCGFYGSSSNRNLCSKCYQVSVKEESTLSESYTNGNSVVSSFSELSLSDEENDHVPVPAPAPAPAGDDDSMAKTKPSRCVCCNKKIGLLGFACRCGGKFCNMHRYPEKHMCPFDYKAFGRAILVRENPLVAHDKLGERI